MKETVLTFIEWADSLSVGRAPKRVVSWGRFSALHCRRCPPSLNSFLTSVPLGPFPSVKSANLIINSSGGRGWPDPLCARRSSPSPVRGGQLPGPLGDGGSQPTRRRRPAHDAAIRVTRRRRRPRAVVTGRRAIDRWILTVPAAVRRV